MTPRRPQPSRRGISLVETVIAAAMLGGAVAATLNVVGQAGRRHALDSRDATGVGLARDLLTEIRTRPLAGTDPRTDNTAGAGREGFNDAEDYLLLADDPPTAEDGSRLGLGDGWSREVTGFYFNADNFTASLADPTNTLFVTVTTLYEGQPVTTMSAIITKGDNQ